MNTQSRTDHDQDHSLVTGLLTGAFVGAGLAMWFVPRVVSALRRRRDEVAEAVARGAREVERYATATKSDQPAAPHSLSL